MEASKRVYPDSQKGIISIEYDAYNVLDAKYGTYGEFKEIAKKGLVSDTGKKARFSKNHTKGMNDDWKGINYWITAKGYGDGPDLCFFTFRKDGEDKYTTPTKKLSSYFKGYEKYLKKR